MESVIEPSNFHLFLSNEFVPSRPPLPTNISQDFFVQVFFRILASYLPPSSPSFSFSQAICQFHALESNFELNRKKGEGSYAHSTLLQWSFMCVCVLCPESHCCCFTFFFFFPFLVHLL